MGEHPGLWQRVVEDPIPGRLAAPRRRGWTMVIDKGMSLADTRGLTEVAGGYIDLWKLPFGTSGLYPERVLKAKVACLLQQGIDVYPGGTFLEIALLQGHLERFYEACREVGFTAVEVSDGTIPLAARERRLAISTAVDFGFVVFSEVGKKDPGEHIPALALRRIMEADFEAGVRGIIVEGRESGQGVGIYDQSGSILEDELTKIVNACPAPDRLIWEAPQKTQQEELIVRFGPNVNLGNIPPGEILALEALRRGLRADTLRHALPGAPEQAAGKGTRG